MEPPTVRDATLSLENRYLFADTIEVFKSHPATGVFDLRNQPPADDVVHVTGKPLLLPQGHGMPCPYRLWNATLAMALQAAPYDITDRSVGAMEGWKPPFLPAPEGGASGRQTW